MIELQGKASTYRLSFDLNTMCAIEEATGRTVVKALKEVRSKRPDGRIVRAILRAVLVDVDDRSDRRLGQILRDIGGVKFLRAAVKGLV